MPLTVDTVMVLVNGPDGGPIEMVYFDKNTSECKLSRKKVFWEDV